MLWWTVAALLLVKAAGFLLARHWLQVQSVRSQVGQRFERIVHGDAWVDEDETCSLAWLVCSRFAHLCDLAVEPRARRHLAQAGWSRPEASMVLCAARLALGLLLGTALFASPLGALLPNLAGAGSEWARAGSALACAALAWLVPGFWVAGRAHARAARLRDDVVMLVPLLHMCFEAGLSLERAFATLSRERPRGALPELAGELEWVLRRIREGEASGVALLEVARALDSAELRDLAALLRQIERSGGALQGPLDELGLRFAERRRSDLRALAAQRSVQLTFVMVCWLVPVLIASIAGPSLLARIFLLG